MPPIEEHLMGDLWPQAWPGARDANYGEVTLEPQGAFEVRSYQTFRLTYTVGQFGLDDTGAIKIVRRWTSDGGDWQAHDPSAANYVSAVASNGVTLDVEVERHPHQRPWYFAVRVTVRRGFMRPGDRIEVVIGDMSGGSPGLLLQSFCERAFEFKVLADPCAACCFVPVASPHIAIVAGAPDRWVLVAPTLRRPGEAFHVGIRAEDRWGNATGAYSGDLRLEVEGAVDGMPGIIRFDTGARGMTVGPLSAPEGRYRFALLSGEGTLLARSNPLVVTQGPVAGYWADLHGQSGETVGIDPIEDYVAFARDVAFLDVTGHQANDFHLTTPFWQRINDVSAEVTQDGRFVMFPGYEWSANTPLGGDHNVFFREEGETIVRSSHTLLEDRSDLGTGAHDLETLFDRLRGKDCVVFAHIGGRPADIARAEDARLRTAVEIHSDWGTFEWIMADAFKLGYRVGVVANSDGHKGAPGACYPGASEFGAYSGLTCYLAPELSRDAIFASMRARRHYATTGARLHLDLAVDLGAGGAVYPADPRIDDRPAHPSTRALMGDIARTDASRVDVAIRIDAASPILSVELLNGTEVVAIHRPYDPDQAKGRVRIEWAGAEYRGRGRQTFWRGTVGIDGGRIARFARFNHWNLDRDFGPLDDARVAVDLVTTGNHVGCDLWLDGKVSGIHIDTGAVSARVALEDIPRDGLRLDAGGLDRNVSLKRLPDRLETAPVDIVLSADVLKGRDNPLWVRVRTEDGHTAWSSPVYLLG